MQSVHGFSGPMDNSRPSVFGQQLPQPLGSNMGDGSGSWLHTTPSQMPWGINQPTLVRFTGEPPAFGQTANDFGRNLPYSHFKRKIEPEPEIMPAAKLHITEEKMAAHMSRLQITSEANSRSNDMVEPEPMCSETCCSDDAEKETLKRLIICKEIQKYNDEILPSAILCKLEKPSTALMLWQPPTGILGKTLTDSVGLERARRAMEEEEQERREQERREQENNMTDNNNSSSLDLNTLVMPAYASPSSSSTDAFAMDL